MVKIIESSHIRDFNTPREAEMLGGTNSQLMA